MKRQTILILILLFAVVAVIQLAIPSFRDFENDDGYVTFVIARNIARGDGFSYNAGEFTSGSTFLWPVILSVVYTFVGDSLPIAAKVFSMLLTCLSIYLAFLITLKISNKEKVALIVALLLTINPWINMWASAAADTMLFTTVTLLAIYLYVTNKEKSAVIMSSLSYLARSEGGFLFLLILFHIFVKDVIARNNFRKIIFKNIAYLLVFGLIISPWVLMIYTNEGNLFPKAFLTKKVMYEYFATTLGPIKFSHIFIMDMIMIMPIVSGVFILALLTRLNRKSLIKNDAILFLWPVVSIFSHVFISYSSTAHRYIMPLLPAIIISVFMLMLDMKKMKIDVIKLFAIMLILALPIQYAILGPKLASINKDSYSHFEISEWIEDNIPENANVAIGELGIIKWETERYYYDVAGIVDEPSVVTENIDGFVNYIRDNKIDYIINPVKYSSKNNGDERVKIKYSILTLSEILNLSGVEWGVYTTENILSSS